MEKFNIEGLETVVNDGRNSSHTYQVNLLARRENILVFDNHLSAYWCWSQLDLTKRYELLHIDRHYDLSQYQPEDQPLLQAEVGTQVKDLIQITRATSMGPLQILRWDNYINLFLAKYPVIDFAFFLTQKDGQLNFEPKYQEIEIYDLFEQTLEEKENWIINIDIDYFFTKPDGQRPIQYYTDEFIRATGRWISKKRKAIAQITICLSPECCGGWDNAMHVANLFGEEFDFHLS